MESQTYPRFDGTQGVRVGGNYVLRGIAIVLTFISAIVMGVAREDVTDNYYDGEVKSTYSAAYV